MHILFLSDNFAPEVNAPASRTFEHCREWVRAGHRVTVITCAPNFPKGAVFGGYRNRLWQREDMAGITVIRVWSYIARNEGFAKRILDYLSYMVTAFLAALFVRRVDVIVGTSPQFFTACAACAVSVVKRRPWVFELRDIWPESIRAVGAMKKEYVLDRLEALELFLYRKATAIVTVTHAFRENLIRRGIDAGKVHVVTNGADTARFVAMDKDVALEQALGLRDKFVLGYIGTHGMAHGLDTLIDAAVLLKQASWAQDCRLMLLGDGAHRARLVRRAHDLGLDNVVFVDTVPKEQVVRYWSILDASIIHLTKNDLFRTVIPSKLFECMAMAIPVLHGVEGESADIVKRHDVGLTFEPENPEALCEAVRRLFHDAVLRERFKRNGPHAAHTYDRAVLAQQMLAQMERLV
ncbi:MULTISPECIES: glycosyltransferase family 4 protein [Novosphingobium]|uniref:glycosyltransferase family 4 protein n=1 Tax=Novosphingobium TaxID=165696 RepID=UPI001CD6565D|nr:glycosyltransferase family 4 protein [Novosphingobium percolationis]MCH7629908.1 glycosyltransferase family 4 protein [Pseudomonadota bacterium]